MESKPSVIPSVKDYISIQSFLNDYYRFRKSENPGFTYEAWSAELGFKSRSFLKMIVTEKRKITASSAASLAKSLALNQNESDYLSLLVNLAQSKDAAVRDLVLEKIFEHRGDFLERQEILQAEVFLKNLELPKLLVLLSFKDLDRSLAGLSRFLSVEVVVIEKHLAVLRDLGLAKALDGPNGATWIPTTESFRVPKNLGSAAIASYHNQSLLEAIDAQNFPAETRRFRSLLLPLSTEDYAQLLTEVESFVKKATAKYDSEQLKAKRLYKLNLNLIPVTPAYEGPSET